MSSICRVLSLLLVLGLPAWSVEPTPGELLRLDTFGDVAQGALPQGWLALSGNWRVQDGRLVGEATDYLSRIVLPVGELEDVAIEAEVRFLKVKNSSRWLSLMVRAGEGGSGPFAVYTSRFERHKGSGLEIGLNRPVEGKREWEILRRGRRGPELRLGQPQTMRFEVRSGFARAFLDGRLVLACELPSETAERGQVGFVVSDVTASFDNVRVEKLPPMGDEERQDIVLAACSLPRVIAHRGASRVFPENTMLAFEQAFARGADGVEMDVRLSKDGQLYLLHDDKLDRTTDGKGPSASRTLAELQSYDAGSWKDPKFKGERVPAFASVMKALKGRGLIVLDLKEQGLGEALSETMRREGVVDQAVACCWNEEQVVDIHTHLPEIPILKLGEVPDRTPDDFCLGWQRRHASGFSMAHASLSPVFMAQANAAGMGVYTWTINSAAEFREALQLGVAGVLTDTPQSARQELRRLLANAWRER